MKKIVLIGDSIREGYAPYVKDQLHGVADVLFPDDNCRFALYLLRNAHVWKGVGNWGDDVDLVHWNAGLWDVLHVLKQEALTEVDHYASIIKRIDTRLRLLFPKAKIVFATSTLGVDSRYENDTSYRLNSEILEYNKAALKALSDTDTVIDDLCKVTEGWTEDYYSDATHHTEKGRKCMSEVVLSCICPLIGIEKDNNGNWIDKN